MLHVYIKSSVMKNQFFKLFKMPRYSILKPFYIKHFHLKQIRYSESFYILYLLKHLTTFGFNHLTSYGENLENIII